MALFLFLVLVAVVLGVFGTIVKGLLYLLVIGIVVLVLALCFGAWRLRRHARRPTR
ncbi:MULTISPECIES: hypothetical protein [Streptomyces]|uniref:Uncharacterized protein n=1 Tax=Streptomyces cacaoi TaxID=1898 RepID=A0A4Y3R5T8_STRCI|nr:MULTISPECIES: hypothetical protein [Streptomyces]NNG88266.1 hypothetical protein [Streptomyces cacaoi]GEB51290.1 hypothetical protein SCA03_38410 [Streptomyces cacaoi]